MKKFRKFLDSKFFEYFYSKNLILLVRSRNCNDFFLFRDIFIENDYGIIRIWGACRIRRGFRNVEELLYR